VGPARVAAHQGDDGGEVSAGGRTADGDRLAGDAVPLGIGDEPTERGVAVVDPGGKAVFGGQAVFDGCDQARGVQSAAREQAVQLARERGAEDEPAAVEVDM